MGVQWGCAPLYLLLVTRRSTVFCTLAPRMCDLAVFSTVQFSPPKGKFFVVTNTSAYFSPGSRPDAPLRSLRFFMRARKIITYCTSWVSRGAAKSVDSLRPAQYYVFGCDFWHGNDRAPSHKWKTSSFSYLFSEIRGIQRSGKMQQRP